MGEKEIDNLSDDVSQLIDGFGEGNRRMFSVSQHAETRKVLCILYGATAQSPDRLGIILADVTRHHQNLHGWSEEQIDDVLNSMAMELDNPTSEIDSEKLQ